MSPENPGDALLREVLLRLEPLFDRMDRIDRSIEDLRHRLDGSDSNMKVLIAAVERLCDMVQPESKTSAAGQDFASLLQRAIQKTD